VCDLPTHLKLTVKLLSLLSPDSRMRSSVGVLLIQLGTPDAATVPALRHYLRQFLGDPRVIEAPRLLWWFILNFRILPTRPKQSAEKYRRIWNEQTGSPLLHLTRLQAEGLERLLPGVPVRFGMQIGNPSVASVVSEMLDQGLERLIVLPMYPQYSATTTASATDALFKALMRERRVPALRIVPPYYSHPAYVDSVATVIREEQAKLAWKPDHFLLSFHGLPVKYVERGDPYLEHVERTKQLLLERLNWPEGRWTLSFQSLFGKEMWLQPYTNHVLEGLARQGIKRVFVATPGFTADCLETIDEIGYEAREIFVQAGGEELHQCRCLNDHPVWIGAMKAMVLEEGKGWV
jgi:ferrochelatase